MRFQLLNVFTKDGEAGNQLAVVFCDRSLSDELMMKICLDFGFSETVFLEGQKLRIFSPGGELPFAGHPTVGAAWSYAKIVNQENFQLETLKGMIECHSTGSGSSVIFPGEVKIQKFSADLISLLKRMNLAIDEIDLDGVRSLNSGPHFVIIPVLSHQALSSAQSPRHLDSQQRPYLVFRESKDVCHVRMFSPLLKDAEDAATGSAACALAGYLRSRGELSGELSVYQGAEIGRSCLIRVSWDESFIKLSGDVKLWGDGELVRV